MRDYEMVLITRPQLSDEEAKLVVDRVVNWVNQQDGKVIKLENWGRRKLAYPINHLYEGNYFFAQFQIGPSQVKGMEKYLNLQEEVIRYLIVKKEG